MHFQIIYYNCLKVYGVERNPEFLQKKIDWDIHWTLELCFWGKWISVLGHMCWANWIIQQLKMLLMFHSLSDYILQLSPGLWCRTQPWISAKEDRVRHPLNTRAVFLGKMDFSFGPYGLSQLNYIKTQMLLIFHVFLEYVYQLTQHLWYEMQPLFSHVEAKWYFHRTLKPLCDHHIHIGSM